MKNNSNVLTEDYKEIIWQNVVDIVVAMGYEDIKDVVWKYNKDGAVAKIEVTFEVPIYLTTK